MIFRFFLIISLSLGFSVQAFAQKEKMDTSYVFSQTDKLLTRFYFSKKYTDFRVRNPNTDRSLRYMPNSGLNVGIGATYQKFTLNIAVPLGILNPDRRDDFPKYLDLQTHFYPTHWIIDLFGQFYNGYTISDFSGKDVSYLREDMKVRKLGLLASYVFNGQKISIDAAMHNSFIQKRSAFSTLVGFEAYTVRVEGDSLIFPVEADYANNFKKADYLHFGPNAGFVGTLVFGKGFFLTGALIGNVGGGYSRWDKDKETVTWQVIPGYSARGYAGYNNKKFSINVNYVYKHLNLASEFDLNQSVNTGNYRLNFVYKFDVSDKFKRTFDKFNPINLLGLGLK